MPSYASPELRLYLHQPQPVFKARVNLASAVYPLLTLPYDTVTLGAAAAIIPDQTLTLGSADGADDKGRVRAQNVASITTIPLGRVSQGVEDGTLNATHGAFITVWDDYRVWAKLPYISPASVAYKDSDIAILSYTTEIPPVANCGPGTAGTILAATGLLTVTLPAAGVNESYAMATGATITGYLWDVEDGTITVGTSTSAVITATFPAGFRWVGLTVTDNNGKVHTTRCPVLSVNPANDVTIKNFQVESHRITQNGQTLGFRILEDVPRSTYPDGCLVMFWDGEPSSPTDRSHMKFIGWHQTDSAGIRAQKTGLLRDTVLNCVDVAGRLATLPGFPQALERVDPATTWEEMPGLTIDKCLHYLMFWHSTAPSLADFFLPPTGSSYPAMRLDSTGASLFDQVNNRAKSMVPDHILTCNTLGQLRVLVDWMLQDAVDRSASAQTLTEDDWSELRFEYNRPPRVHVLKASAVVCSTNWLVIGSQNTLPLAFCIAPGDTFGQGVSEAVQGEQLAISQTALNNCTGHRYARMNARYGPFSIVEPSGDVWALEPALMQRVELQISALTAAQRGLDATTLYGQVKEINLRYSTDKTGTWIAPTLVWEREVIGLPAQTVEIIDTGDAPATQPAPDVPTTPPDFGLITGQQLVAGIGIDGYVYRTSNFQTASGSGGPTWDRVDTLIADTIYSFVVDPFSPGYILGAGAISGWIANDTGIYRVVDLFGTATATLVHTFTTATVGASYHWRSIQASFGGYFAAGVNPWLLCVSYYGATAGHTGTWATYSIDGGVTWSTEVQISAFFDTGTFARFNPIGVYTSPKTPGLAYTAAHVAQSANPNEPLVRFGTWPDSGSLSVSGLTNTATYEVNVTETGAVPGTTEDAGFLIIAPPANTKRMIVTGTWSATRTRTGGLGTVGMSLDIYDPASSSSTDDLAFTTPAYNSTNNGTFTIEWSFASWLTLDWPVNSDSIVSAPPSSGNFGARLRPYTNCNGTAGQTVTGNVTIVLTVAEIELDDGTIYVPSLADSDPAVADGYVSTDWGATWAGMNQVGMIRPVHGQAGSIHLPWPTNAAEQISYYGALDRTTVRQFRLKRTAGTVQTDVSPSSGGVLYGVNRFGFGVRTYDSNRQYVLLAGIGNDTSASASADLHAVFVSSDYGDTWSTIVIPIVDASAPAGRPAYEAAFGGDSEQIIFIWGPGSYISYSSNLGVAVDSRSGNLAALGLTTGLIGIAGGPTP